MSDTFMTTTERATFFSLLLILHTKFGSSMSSRERLEILMYHNGDSRDMYRAILSRNNQNERTMARILERLDRDASREARRIDSDNRCDYATPTHYTPTHRASAQHYQTYHLDHNGARVIMEPINSAANADALATGVLLTGLAAVISAMRSSK